MIIPVRCFSCGTVIADRWEAFNELVVEEGKALSEAMDELGLIRYCCRRMYVSHAELILEIAPFSAPLQK